MLWMTLKACDEVVHRFAFIAYLIHTHKEGKPTQTHTKRPFFNIAISMTTAIILYSIFKKNEQINTVYRV